MSQSMVSGNEPASGIVHDDMVRSRWRRWWLAAQVAVSLLLAGGVLMWLLMAPHGPTKPAAAPRPNVQVVRHAGPGRLEIDPDSALAAKLEIVVVEASQLSIPTLRVTGTVAASLRPSHSGSGDEWQFDDPEVLSAFYDWQKALADIAFAESQRERIAELTNSRIAAQRRIVERLERLVRAGTDTMADLELARAELLERDIEARKDTREAEAAIWAARQDEAVLVRRLQLAGLEPTMFAEATADVDIVVADVPEESQARVRVGQQCEARFFGLPRRVFSGVVRSIAPVLSRERRSLRVLFFVDDPHDELRPGLFADIGLGTDPRETLLIPSESVIHIGRSDFVFLEVPEEPGIWQVAEVEVGDVINGQIEVLRGVGAGQRVIGRGAILLKPAAAESLPASSGASQVTLPEAVR